jgi:hypothetical protein
MNSSNNQPAQVRLNAPVLFVVFNRPDTTRRVFAAIRAAQPKRLYVAADGPRKDKESDCAKMAQVREIATNVDWDCEVKTLFRSHNAGCGKAVSGAINWFFQNEEMGIILEDDCLPHPHFWPFCDELLQRYRHDERVMAISGSNVPNDHRRTPYSYYFSRHFFCWGWATWARAWRHFDYDMGLWPMAKADGLLDGMFRGERRMANYWTGIFDRVSQGKISCWLYQWKLACWLQNGLQINADANLVSNIGFGGQATHTKHGDNPFAALPVEPVVFPLKHPPLIVPNVRADQSFAREWLAPSLPKRAMRKVKRISDRAFATVRPPRHKATGSRT